MIAADLTDDVDVGSAGRRAADGHRLSRWCLGPFLALLMLTFSGGAAPAGTPPVHRQHNGVLVVDSQRLSVLYQGQLISQRQLSALTEHRRGMFYAGDVASAERGHAHAFDTMAQLDTYSRHLSER